MKSFLGNEYVTKNDKIYGFNIMGIVKCSTKDDVKAAFGEPDYVETIIGEFTDSKDQNFIP